MGLERPTHELQEDLGHELDVRVQPIIRRDDVVVSGRFVDTTQPDEIIKEMKPWRLKEGNILEEEQIVLPDLVI